MVAAEVQRNYATANIFGAYIMNMREIPGKKTSDREEDKKREQEWFELIDDYIEQE